jgi:hypothetical protein
MCGGQLSLVIYLSLEEDEGGSFPLSLSLSKLHGRMTYGEVGKVGRRTMLSLVLCNGKWLKVAWSQVHYFFLFVLTFKKVGKIFPS